MENWERISSPSPFPNRCRYGVWIGMDVGVTNWSSVDVVQHSHPPATALSDFPFFVCLWLDLRVPVLKLCSNVKQYLIKLFSSSS